LTFEHVWVMSEETGCFVDLQCPFKSRYSYFD